ncbi:aspartate/glutamate racemase family protein [Halodurantibacterium flavum]|uniref:Aspartate/glutamate racemase family protein n=1 Tax=Halodurantibacterium flavum TaxID=1382802 RepID=A0ABW4RZQ9_9RHOB
MRIALINPNSTVSMTAKMAAAARAAAGPGVEIEARTCAGSPPAIQGPEDAEAAVPHLLAEALAAEASGADAVVIGCFDDPGLTDLRAALRIPVLGIGQAGFHAAALMGHRFGVVTTLAGSVPGVAGNIRRYGLADRCSGVRASGVAVLELEDPGSGARARVSAELARALAEDAPGAIVLGCAGMADLAPGLTAEHGVPVIDGVAAATGLAAALVQLRQTGTA